MNLPGYRLHQLKGERKGQWAVSVSGNWRLVFVFEGANASDVDLVDYHWSSISRTGIAKRSEADVSSWTRSNTNRPED